MTEKDFVRIRNIFKCDQDTQMVFNKRMIMIMTIIICIIITYISNNNLYYY